jgi:hypothetical protein
LQWLHSILFRFFFNVDKFDGCFTKQWLCSTYLIPINLLQYVRVHIYYTGLFTRGVFLNFFLPQPIIHIATISWFQILKIIITESTMALRPVSLTLKQKCLVNSKNLFYNNDEMTDMLLIYGECGKNSVAAADVYKPIVHTSNTFYLH